MSCLLRKMVSELLYRACAIAESRSLDPRQAVNAMTQPDYSLQFYLNEISANRVLTKAEEIELFKLAAEGDGEARAEIIRCNLKFVIQVAQKFRSRGLPLEDLIQEGNIGLMEAVGKFDHKLGFRFSTYAAFWIRQAIQVAIRQRGSLIRLPVRKARLLGFMNEVVQESWSMKGRPPSESELATRLGVTPRQARDLAHMGEAVLSLDTPVGEDGTPLMDMIPDDRFVPVDRMSLESERQAKVAAAMRHLSERETIVISERFGLREEGSRSLRKVSSCLGLSQEGVRRIEQRALAKLRRPHIRESMAGLI